MTSAILPHCSLDGSMPVGLCAQPCRRMMDPSGALPMSSIMPSKSRAMFLGSKYLYESNGTPASAKMFLWFGHDGLEM